MSNTLAGRENFRFCPSCGAKAAPGAAFCGNCGQSLKIASTAKKPVYPPSPYPNPTPMVAPATQLLITESGHSLQLAGWWQRAAGYILDDLILLIPIYGFQILLGTILYSHPSAVINHTAGVAAGLIATLFALAVDIVYAGWMLSQRGQTVGMMAAGIIAVDRSGESIGHTQAWRRIVAQVMIVGIWGLLTYFFGFFDNSHTPDTFEFIFIVAALLTYLWPIGSPLNQTLQDKAANTVVVIKNKIPNGQVI